MIQDVVQMMDIDDDDEEPWEDIEGFEMGPGIRPEPMQLAIEDDTEAKQKNERGVKNDPEMIGQAKKHLEGLVSSCSKNKLRVAKATKKAKDDKKFEYFAEQLSGGEAHIEEVLKTYQAMMVNENFAHKDLKGLKKEVNGAIRDVNKYMTFCRALGV